MFTKESISRMVTVIIILILLLTGFAPIQTATATTSKTADNQISNLTGDTPAVAAAREATKVGLGNNNATKSGSGKLVTGGGTFTVNTANDSNTVGDGELSLREAIQIANGTLLGPFSSAERGQLSGCTFSAGGMITNTCGGGNNLIQFKPTLTQVMLNGRLDSTSADNLTITGQVNSGKLIVNSTANDLAFWVGSNNVDISQMAIINANLPIGVVSNVALKGLRFHDNYLGVTPDMTSCTDVRLTRGPDFDVILFDGSGSSTAGDGSAYIYGNTMGCANNDGIAVSNVSYVYIGEDATGHLSRNYIGIDQLGHALPVGRSSSGSGVSLCCASNAQNSVIVSNTIGYAPDHGVYLSVSPNNSLIGNNLYHNGKAGVLVENSSSIILKDNLAHSNGSSGLWLSGAQTTNNSISGGAYYSNGAAGITEGEGANTNWWLNVSTFDNAGLGIDKNDNGLPDATGGISITSIGQSAGVVTVNGQYSGTVFLITIYHIELYRLAPDPSGFGEGRTYLGAFDLQWNISNDTTWHIIDPSGQADCYTAILTVKDPLNVNDNTSYEFAANFGTCIPAPTVTAIIRSNTNPTGAASVNFHVTFSEFVTGVDTSDFKLTTTGVSGATVSGVSGSGSVYTVTVNTGTGNGTIRLDVPASATITNLVGTPPTGLPYTSGQTYTIIKTHTLFLPLIRR